MSKKIGKKIANGFDFVMKKMNKSEVYYAAAMFNGALVGPLLATGSYKLAGAGAISSAVMYGFGLEADLQKEKYNKIAKKVM
ncbi:MAG: hypothetical protein GOV02_03500 [Candidatus Aenigmarchaeota archaeon]|nr:hypothetical protein [Candidatus Aenigmarchaeota archaeon]